MWLSLCLEGLYADETEKPHLGAFPVVDGYDFQHSGSKNPFL